jgi:hypothetical protein
MLSTDAINSIVVKAQIAHQTNFVPTCVFYAIRFSIETKSQKNETLVVDDSALRRR